MDETPEGYQARNREEIASIIGNFRSAASSLGNLAGGVAGEMAYRMSDEGRRSAKRRQERRNAAWLRAFKRLSAGLAAVLVATIGISLVVGPIGLGGLVLMILAMVLVTCSILVWSSSSSKAPPERFAQTTEIAQLPARTERWLEGQRPALPAPAQRQLDQIGVGLEQLGAQLASLDPREPAAVEVRRLVGEELPELVRGYQRVPEPLRRQPLNGGLTPDRQLCDGLETIGEEIARMNNKLAQGDLHSLATQQRFLELKYKGESASEN